MSRRNTGCPSLYEIQCDNGEIDEDTWQYEPVDCDGYYRIEYYKYANSFPKEWALSHLPDTGPEQCENCYDYGTIDNLFVGYCLNCAQYEYNGERGSGMGEVDCPSVEVTTKDTADEYDVNPPSVQENPAETAAFRMEKLIAQLRECSDDLDYVFRIAEGKVSSDDHHSHSFFGIEKK